MLKKIIPFIIILLILSGCSNSIFAPPGKSKDMTIEGEFVILEDYYYLMDVIQYDYFIGFITEDELYIIDTLYKLKDYRNPMHTYTYDKDGIPVLDTFYIYDYEIIIEMKEGTLLGNKRESYNIEEDNKMIDIVYSSQYAKITGKISNISERALPGLRVFIITSDDDIE